MELNENIYENSKMNYVNNAIDKATSNYIHGSSS